MNKKVILASISVATLSCGIAVPTFADDPASGSATTDFSVTVTPYLNLELSSNDVHLSVTPSSSGTFGSTYFTATASTNNALGYSLNLAIKDTDTEQAVLTTNLTSDTINVNDGTKPVIPTFSTDDVLTTEQFRTTSSTDHLNHWAMSINTATNTAIGYKKALSESTINQSDGPIAEEVTTLNLATKLDLLTAPGSYSAYFNFEIVANVGDSIHTDGKYPADTLLRAYEIAYTKAGKPMYIEDENATTIPGWRPMTSADTAGGKQVRFAIQDINMTFTEDGVTKSVCEWAKSSEADNSYIDEALVLDIRDGNSYFIAKTADDKCWMTQNLDLVLSNSKTLTHADTDLGWTTSDSSATWTPPTAAQPVAINSDYNWGSYNEPRSIEGGNVWVGTSGSTTADPEFSTLASCVTAFSEDACQHYHIGNYYNWAAAIASTDSSSMATEYNNAPNSICPAGWRLPIARDSNDEMREVGNLMFKEGIVERFYSSSYLSDGFNKIRSAPLYLNRAGDIYQSSRSDYKSQGQYWTATQGWSNIVSYYYYETSSSINTASSSNRDYGMTIRCIAR